MKYDIVSWMQVEGFIKDVCNMYTNKTFTGVYGIPRGGLVLAVMLSHKLNIPLLAAPANDCLIVDDICDSGESLIHFIQNTTSINKPNYTVVTMFSNKEAIVQPDFSSFTKEDKWIIFPWEAR